MTNYSGIYQRIMDEIEANQAEWMKQRYTIEPEEVLEFDQEFMMMRRSRAHFKYHLKEADNILKGKKEDKLCSNVWGGILR